MFPITHFIKGFFKNLFNKKISKLAFVSANNHIDKSAVVYRFAKIKGSSIGRYSYVGNDTDVENSCIGGFCSISDHCRLGLGAHTLNKLSTCPIFTQKQNGCHVQWIEEDVCETHHEDLIIGNDVWIGSHVLIKSGITICDGAVIAAGAVVVKDVPPYAVVGGVPAKVIRYRFDENTIKKLEEMKWWNLPDDVLRNNISIFQDDIIDFEKLEKIVNSNKC